MRWVRMALALARLQHIPWRPCIRRLMTSSTSLRHQAAADDVPGGLHRLGIDAVRGLATQVAREVLLRVAGEPIHKPGAAPRRPGRAVSVQRGRHARPVRACRPSLPPAARHQLDPARAPDPSAARHAHSSPGPCCGSSPPRRPAPPPAQLAPRQLRPPPDTPSAPGASAAFPARGRPARQPDPHLDLLPADRCGRCLGLRRRPTQTRALPGRCCRARRPLGSAGSSPRAAWRWTLPVERHLSTSSIACPSLATPCLPHPVLDASSVGDAFALPNAV